jgi:hypothetical protein
MDHYSILDQSSSSPATEGEMPASSATKSAAASVSAGIAAANAHPAKSAETAPRFPGEDAGRSLAEMAHRDLDAALQLLAERAQYITGASGAAIALRRGDHHDMLCRATSGSNAPQLGALLSMEYGLSGESVRSRQVLRCDDTERDPRVNHDVCRALGIASVVVMPIASEEQVLGVFELLSDKPRAFTERDLSALARLSEMVETSVKHAVAAQTLPTVKPVGEDQPVVAAVAAEPPQPESNIPELSASPAPSARPEPPPGEASAPAQASVPAEESAPEKQEKEEVPPVSRKPLFWSAAARPASGQASSAHQSVPVPAVLRNLRKCQTCGFPVSQGRAFCVECEEKQWRGGRPSQHAAGPSGDHPTPSSPPLNAFRVEENGTVPQESLQAPVSYQPVVPAIETPTVKPSVAQTFTTSSSDVSVESPASDTATSFLSGGLQSESWCAANKYILAALLTVAIVIAAIAWLR